MVIRKKRVWTMFHETFFLNRSQMSEIMMLARKIENSGIKNMNQANISSETMLGNNVIKSQPQYCKGSGLLLFENQFLSSFGRCALEKNSTLADFSSMWLMHYHLSSPDGPGPSFWSELVKEFFVPGKFFTKEEIKDCIANHHWSQTQKVLSSGSVSSTATIFINTYLEKEGLGDLKIFSKISDNHFEVRQPEFQDSNVLYFAMNHYLENSNPGSGAILLETIINSDLPKIFLIPPTRFEKILDDMRSKGYIEIARVSQPYTVFLKQGRESALSNIYGT